MKNKYIGTLIALMNSLVCFCQTGNQVVEHKRVYASKSAKAEKFYQEGYNDYKQKDFSKAIAAYRMAIVFDSNFIDAYNNLGLAYRKMNQLDSAEHYYFVSLRKYPKGGTPLLDLAIVEEHRNNIKKAIDYYKKYVALKKDDPEGYYGLLRMYEQLQMFPEAIDNGKIAEKYYKKMNSPYIGDCYNFLCLAYFYSKDREMAKTYLELAQNAGVTVDQHVIDGLK